MLDIYDLIDRADRGDLPTYQAERKQSARALAEDFCEHFRKFEAPQSRWLNDSTTTRTLTLPRSNIAQNALEEPEK